MTNLPLQYLRVAFLGLIGVILTSCSTSLAPNYDEAIVDSLVSINQRTMELFASTSSGTSESDYEKRQKAYNSIIGGIDALVVQARSRPTPEVQLIEKASKNLRSRGVPIIEDEGAPSAKALEKLSETVKKMRDTDKKQGVTVVEAQAFKGQATVYLDQALTYESFLER